MKWGVTEYRPVPIKRSSGMKNDNGTDNVKTDQPGGKSWFAKAAVLCVVAAVGVASYLVALGRSGSGGVSDTPSTVRWTAYRLDGDEASPLGSSAIPQDAWSVDGNSIRLQLVNSSIPKIKGMSVKTDGNGRLVVTPSYDRSAGDIQTMDLSISDWRIEGGVAGKVKEVTVKRPNGTGTAKRIEAGSE